MYRSETERLEKIQQKYFDEVESRRAAYIIKTVLELLKSCRKGKSKKGCIFKQPDSGIIMRYVQLSSQVSRPLRNMAPIKETLDVLNKPTTIPIRYISLRYKIESS
ncbi:unnamed protein product [Angiostrongylus costaricensis]|uniref:Uncharacterized protein n=1 Tax=Angiostrongylus costaricensis TaxID=334426 RepID=A0A0R3Q266_ANGCS|nr:unnamed protein product [Angiostrongylus costaricensis]